MKERLLSKETMVLYQWGSKMQKFGLQFGWKGSNYTAIRKYTAGALSISVWTRWMTKGRMSALF